MWCLSIFFCINHFCKEILSYATSPLARWMNSTGKWNENNNTNPSNLFKHNNNNTTSQVLHLGANVRITLHNFEKSGNGEVIWRFRNSLKKLELLNWCYVQDWMRCGGEAQGWNKFTNCLRTWQLRHLWLVTIRFFWTSGRDSSRWVGALFLSSLRLSH